MATIPDIARRLSVSESTVRNWLRAYRDLIPTSVGRDGYRRYALRRYQEIAALREQRLPAAAIRAALSGEATDADPALTVEARTLAVWERIAEALERIADHLDRQWGTD